MSAGIDALEFLRQALRLHLRTDVGNQPVLNQDATALVAFRSGIEQPRVEDGERAHLLGRLRRSETHAAGSFGLSARVSTSRQAMRTATPISTCSRIRLRSMSSATSLSISTPRFIGPGCMMSASGLAAASLS